MPRPASAGHEAHAFFQTRKRVPSGIDSNSLTCGYGIVGHPDEGGDGAECGAKLAATARKPRWQASSEPVRP